nr:SGNH/GDSL hydrolase family protein [Aquibacillus albus]
MKPDTNKTLTFDQEQSVTIPPGEEIHSDPIPYQVTDGEDLTVSVNVSSETGPATWHWFSYQTTYISKEGDYTESNDEEAFSETVNSWFWLSGVDVKTESNKKSRVIVALGDSITDGYMSTVNANHRWTDFLNERLDEEISNQTFSVLNQGITGNRILADSPIFGEKALSRLDRDVFSQTGVTDVILYEGINDVGHQPHVFDADKIIFGMKEIASKAHDRGLRIYAATLTPFNAFTDDSNYYTDEGEATRQEVNKWIRNNDVFDGFFDFDKAIVDPSSPDKILPEYDSGDHLHPNDRGLEKLADSIDLSMFEKPLNRGKAFVN